MTLVIRPGAQCVSMTDEEFTQALLDAMALPIDRIPNLS
jgi:hypothetical protein